MVNARCMVNYEDEDDWSWVCPITAFHIYITARLLLSKIWFVMLTKYIRALGLVHTLYHQVLSSIFSLGIIVHLLFDNISYLEYMKISRIAKHSGSWYEEDPNILKRALSSYIKDAVDAQGLTREKVKVIIVPHAGYVYSGGTAAYSFSRLLAPNHIPGTSHLLPKAGIKRIVLVGPCHHTMVVNSRDRLAAFSGADTVETPLGTLEVDRKTVIKMIADHPNVFTEMPLDEDQKEHSLEMQYPFLALICHSIQILPIYVGKLSIEQTRRLSRCLQDLFEDEGTVFVISSDFCHWGSIFRYLPMPDSSSAHKNIDDHIASLDKEAKDIISAKSPNLENWYAYLDRTKNTICGRYPLGVLIAMLENVYMKGKPICMRFNHYSYSKKIQNPKSDSRVSYVAGYGIFDNQE